MHNSAQRDFGDVSYREAASPDRIRVPISHIITHFLRCWATIILAVTAAPGAFADSSTLYTRPMLAVDPNMHTGSVTRTSTDAAGRLGVTGSLDKTVRIWSLEGNGDLLRTIRMPSGPGDVGKIYAVAMSPDGNTIAAGGWTRISDEDRHEQIYLFDTQSGKMTSVLGQLPTVVLHLAFSPDGSRLATVLGGGEGMRLYANRISIGWREIARDTAYGGNSYGIAFTSDGQFATTSYDGYLRLYDREGNEVRSVRAGLPKPYGLAFNPRNGKLAVGSAEKPVVSVYDGMTLRELPGPELEGVVNGDLSSVAWSLDGATLFAGGRYDEGGNNPVLAWSGWGSGIRRSLPAGSGTVASLSPLASGRLFVAAQDPFLGTISTTGELVWFRASEQMDARDQASSLAVSADGMVVDFTYDALGRSRARFDIDAFALTKDPLRTGATSAPLQKGIDVAHWNNSLQPTLNGTPLPIDQDERSRSMAIHPDRERFLLGTDWALRAFDRDGNLLWRKDVPGVVWAVNIAADGLVAVAAYGDGTIRWHRMDNGAELLALFPLRRDHDWVIWEPGGRFSSKNGAPWMLKWYINRGWNQEPLEIQAGGVPKSFRPDVIRRVLPQLGTLGAVYSAEETERADAFRRRIGGFNPGAQLHVLAVGVGTYPKAGERLKLRWADKDAADIFEKLSDQTAWLYRPGFLMLLRQEEANGLAILDQLGRLRERVKRTSVVGRDLAVIMFSGHGVVRGEGETKDFFLLPYDIDVGTEARIRRTGISGNDLESQIYEIAKYSRVIVLLDTCNSGAALGSDIGGDFEVLRRLSTRSNVTVLASSDSANASREADQWENGAFTEVMIEALGVYADSDENGMISMDELIDYVTRRLPVLSDNRQSPTIQRKFGGDLFASGL